jgi:hypothetical protein
MADAEEATELEEERAMEVLVFSIFDWYHKELDYKHLYIPDLNNSGDGLGIGDNIRKTGHGNGRGEGHGGSAVVMF